MINELILTNILIFFLLWIFRKENALELHIATKGLSKKYGLKTFVLIGAVLIYLTITTPIYIGIWIWIWY